MESTSPWRSRPVFVTSTFRDMHAERDHLRDFVFPELAERLRARRHEIEPIDLRWGVETVSVDDERDKELLVLKVCLAEIERSRPFLIALVGDRYGWVPPEERMESAAREAGYEAELSGKSVTALEIEFGVLDSLEQGRRSYFYFRSPLPYDQMDPETAALYSDAHSPRPGAAEAAGRLRDLKRRIGREMRDRVRHYNVTWDPERQTVTGLEQWGAQVLEDLWRDLEEETSEFARLEPPSWQEQERLILDDFVQHRGRDFVGRAEITSKLTSVAESPPAEQPALACVTGGPGSGKSALFARLCRELQDHDALLLTHAAGISGRSISVEWMLRRWVDELADHLGIADPLPDDAGAAPEDAALPAGPGGASPAQVVATFGDLLAGAAERTRVVLLIDALNEFEPTDRARYLTWLPRSWPDNARLLATAIPGPASQTLAELTGGAALELPPLSEPEAQGIAYAVCRRYHREIHPEIVDALVARQAGDGLRASTNPLWLELAMEELNLLDADDFARAETRFEGTPEQKLHQMLLDVADRLPPEVEGLYGWLLDRTEELHGLPMARGFADLIALSRHGWREADLRELLPRAARLLYPDAASEQVQWNPLAFAQLRRSYRAQLRTGGTQMQWDFLHAQMRLAITRRNLTDADTVHSLHACVADHLDGLASGDPLKQSELMVHFIGADDRPRAAAFYGLGGSREEQAGATRALAAHILAHEGEEPNPGIEWALSLLEAPQAQPVLAGGQQAMLCTLFGGDLSYALEDEARPATMIALLTGLTAVQARLCEEQGGGELAQALARLGADIRNTLALNRMRLAEFQDKAGRYDDALHSYQEAIRIFEQARADNPDSPAATQVLAVACSKTGDFLAHIGRHGEAGPYHQQAIELEQAATTPDEGSFSHLGETKAGVLASRLGRAGQIDQAMELHLQQIGEIEAEAGRMPEGRPARDLMASYLDLADLLRDAGRALEALPHLERGLELGEARYEEDPTTGTAEDLCAALLRMGRHWLEAAEQPDRAMPFYERLLELRQRLHARNPDTGTRRGVAEALHHVAGALGAAGDRLPEARDRLAEACEIYMEAYNDSRTPSNAADAARAYGSLGMLCAALGDSEQGAKYLNDAKVILEWMAGQGADLQAEGVGDLLEQLGTLAGASRTAPPGKYGGGKDGGGKSKGSGGGTQSGSYGGGKSKGSGGGYFKKL